jgi:penicillin amidase
VVKQRLEAKDKFTLDDFKSIQHESTSLPGQALINLSKRVKWKAKHLSDYAQVVQQWDGVLTTDAKGAPIYAAWLRELHREFYLPRMPKELHAHLNFLSVKVMFNALANPDARWFGKDPVAGRDELLRSSFAAAVAVLEKKLVADAKDATWGQLHTVTFRHPLSALGAGYQKSFDLGPVGRPGDAYTPNNTRHDENFQQIHGATYRHLFDLSDWDRGLATSAPGQSGQPGSPHYGDLLPLWARGEYFPLAYSPTKVNDVTKHRLTLSPAAK